MPETNPLLTYTTPTITDLGDLRTLTSNSKGSAGGEGNGDS